MAESETEITSEELQKEIAEILDHASLENTSTKKVIQKLESKLGLDLTQKKKLIDQLVMDYVNNMDSDEESEEEEPPKAKAAPKKKIKKEDEDEDDDDINDDSNDSDWGLQYQHDGHLLDGYSDNVYHAQPQGPAVTTSGMRHLIIQEPQAVGVVLKRVHHNEEDEADIFGTLTAKKLRKLSEKQRDSMMIQINQLFYKNCHRRKDPPKRRMVHKATSTGPLMMIQCEAKKIYRLEKANVPAGGPVADAIANLRNTIASTIKARSDVPSSNVPNPTHLPFATSTNTPTNEIPVENNADADYQCGAM